MYVAEFFRIRKSTRLFNQAFVVFL